MGSEEYVYMIFVMVPFFKSDVIVVTRGLTPHLFYYNLLCPINVQENKYKY